MLYFYLEWIMEPRLKHSSDLKHVCTYEYVPLAIVDAVLSHFSSLSYALPPTNRSLGLELRALGLCAFLQFARGL